jgi:hypothetical protein
MKSPGKAEHVRQNVLYVSRLMEHIPHFVFYGTLLGVVRDGDVIPNDDDVDIMTDMLSRNDVLRAIDESGLEINWLSPLNQSPYFLQAHRVIDGDRTLIDFYFYEWGANAEYVIDRWNFLGKWRRDAFSLFIPSRLLFPIRKISFQGSEVSVPARAEECCQYLYGDSWRVPLGTGAYSMVLLKNRPLVRTDFLGMLFCELVNIYRVYPIFRLDIYASAIAHSVLKKVLSAEQVAAIARRFGGRRAIGKRKMPDRNNARVQIPK